MANLQSFTDYTGRILKDEPNFVCQKDVFVDRSCFAQEVPDTEVFPDDWTGTLSNCNLDNVKLPAGAVVAGEHGCARRHALQKDKRTWNIDKGGNPTTLVNEKYWALRGYSIDPKDIPVDKVDDVEELHLDVLSGNLTVEQLKAMGGDTTLIDKMVAEIIAFGLKGEITDKLAQSVNVDLGV